MSSSLSLRALILAQQAVARGVRGGIAPYGRFRGVEVDQYVRWAGIALPANLSTPGVPWCASAVGWLHVHASGWGDADTPRLYNGCPRTPGAIHLADRAPVHTRLAAPRPGAVFVFDRGRGRGHTGFVEYVHAPGQPGPLPGQIVTVEPDTNAAGSTTGDAWGRHTWNPSDGSRGTNVRFFDLGISPTENT